MTETGSHFVEVSECLYCIQQFDTAAPMLPKNT